MTWTRSDSPVHFALAFRFVKVKVQTTMRTTANPTRMASMHAYAFGTPNKSSGNSATDSLTHAMSLEYPPERP